MGAFQGMMLIHQLSLLFLIRSACVSIVSWEAVNIKAQTYTHTQVHQLYQAGMNLQQADDNK